MRSRCQKKECGREMSKYTPVVITEDLWEALDALDALPETHETEWYKRLSEAAEEASRVVVLDEQVVTRH